MSTTIRCSGEGCRAELTPDEARLNKNLCYDCVRWIKKLQTLTAERDEACQHLAAAAMRADMARADARDFVLRATAIESAARYVMNTCHTTCGCNSAANPCPHCRLRVALSLPGAPQ